MAIVNVGSRYFKHFLKLFDTQASLNALPTKVACLTDRDPVRKMKTGGYWEKCYPFESGMNTGEFDYQINAEDDINLYATHPNIRVYSQYKDKGKTFEYDLVLYNSKSPLLLTDSISNQDELKTMMEKDKLDEMLAVMKKSKENERIEASIKDSVWSEEDKMKAVLASRYLNSVGKGENALELSVKLKENADLPDGDANKKDFVVPQYINEALTWLLQ